MSTTRGQPSLTVEERERVVAAIKNRIATVHGGEQAGLATELGVTRSAVSQAVGGKTSPSFKMARALARAMGITLEELLSGEPSHARYTNRELAREMAVRSHLLPEAIAQIDSQAHHYDGDPSPLDWFEAYQGADRQIRMFGASPKAREDAAEQSRRVTARAVRETRPKLPGRKSS